MILFLHFFRLFIDHLAYFWKLIKFLFWFIVFYMLITFLFFFKILKLSLFLISSRLWLNKFLPLLFILDSTMTILWIKLERFILTLVNFFFLKHVHILRLEYRLNFRKLFFFIILDLLILLIPWSLFSNFIFLLVSHLHLILFI